MSDYPLFIPEFMLYTKSSLLWFKITTKLREFRNYLLMDISLSPACGGWNYPSSDRSSLLSISLSSSGSA